ncbi:MAG: 1-phosphofructokinase [Haloplasmataceae bacterium]|jgi:1-phosphofructokinase|nr:1-phosphofructokinase [Haloplasmataceae bacterium]
MIYSCTLNPSIDYIVWLDQFIEGEVNRTTKETFYPGGKGVNVSVLLNNLKIKTTLLGFVGGFIGNALISELNENKYLKLDFVKVKENTRINVIMQANPESRISANGPTISNEAYDELINKVKKIKENDVFVLSGSIPTSIKKDVYGEIAEIVKQKKAILVVDTTKDRLLNLLKFNPLFVKPNKSELEEIFNVRIKDDKEIIKYAKLLIEKGAKNVLVSLGGDGAILVTHDKIYRANTPNGKVVNTVGAGDSMVAGFVAEYLKSQSFTEALKFGSACGSATAFSLGLGEEDFIKTLYNSIDVKEIYE